MGSFSFSRETVSCCLWDLLPRPRVEPRPAALGVQSLSHWTTRGYPLQNSGLENSMDSPWCCEESDTTERLSFHFKDSLDLEENIAKISTLKSGTNLQEVCTHVGFLPQGELSLGSEFI